MYSFKKIDKYNLFLEEDSQEGNLLAESLLQDKFQVIEVLQEKKDRKVSLIDIQGQKFVLKMERGRGILDRLIKSRGKTTFLNALKLRKKGLKEVYNVRLAIEKRRGLGISHTYFLSDYIEGKDVTSSDYPEVMKLLQKLHSLGHYHGDSKPKNFIKTDEGIVLIDSKLKKARLTWLGMCKDVIRFQRRTTDILDLSVYFPNYKRYVSYYLAIALIYKKEIFRGASFLEEVL